MWPFSKSSHSLLESGLTQGMTDWHSHILPGVDDGIKTLDDSLKALERLEQWGVKDLWLTPHIMEDCPNTPDELKERFEVLKQNYNGGINLHLAAEHMLDTLFEERLENNEVMPIGPAKRHLLVETSYFNPPIDFYVLIDRILRKGYFPLLAHPERYRYMSDKDYYKLRDRNVAFQINYNSIVGGYGEEARKKAEWLLKKGLVDALGSDLHRLSAAEQLIEKSPSKHQFIELAKEVALKSADNNL